MVDFNLDMKSGPVCSWAPPGPRCRFFFWHSLPSAHPRMWYEPQWNRTALLLAWSFHVQSEIGKITRSGFSKMGLFFTILFHGADVGSCFSALSKVQGLTPVPVQRRHLSSGESVSMSLSPSRSHGRALFEAWKVICLASQRSPQFLASESLDKPNSSDSLYKVWFIEVPR